MLLKNNPDDTDVPFFPFPLHESDRGDYQTVNHLMSMPIHLNRQAAEVLRLADGVRPLSGVIERLVELYPDAGGIKPIRSKVFDLFTILTAKELVWWRKIPAISVPVSPPTSLFWEITAACNLQCLHCVVKAGVKEKGELSIDRCLTLAEELSAFGVENIAFSGGEPLLRPDFFRIAEYVKKLGMAVQVATNGTLVTPQVARDLMDLDAHVQVSLDGSTEEIHDILRPGRKAFARTITGIRALVAAGHEVTIATVLSTLNIKDIPAIITLTEELGATTFRLLPFIPKGRGELNFDLEVPPAQVKELIRYLHEMRGKTKLDFVPFEFEEMLDGGVCSDPPEPDKLLQCGGAVDYATITPIGEVLPCHYFEGVRADNVKSNTFRDVWYHSRFLNYFRHLNVADLHGNCSTCSWLPRCTGSCRAVNFAKGDLFGGNKACWVSEGTIT